MLPPLEGNAKFALRIWQKLGREINWNGLPVLIELYDVQDPEALIDDLIAIQDQLSASRRPHE